MRKFVALRVMAALAQETRLDAFRLLAMRAPDGLHATEIADMLRVAKNTMSLHFRVLEDAGLVTAQRHGRHVTYRADMKTYDALLEFMASRDGSSARVAEPDAAAEPSDSIR